MKSPGLKKILYNWILLYYFYNRYPINFSNKNKENEIKEPEFDKALKFKNEILELFKFIKTNYETSSKILIFHPKTNEYFIKLAKEHGFKTIVLDSSMDNKSWTFDYDSHWTCYGHEQVADQITIGLNEYLKGKE
jgi:2-hydroxy-3-keto-5-methylthiopentenyl-1-phosphate phosphatase